MIQRLQTLFLILVVIANLLMLNFNLWSGEAVNDQGETIETVVLNVLEIEYNPSLEGQSQEQDSVIWLSALAAASTLIAIIAIFLFNNRPLQLKVSRFGMLLEAALIAITFFYVDTAQSYLVNPMTASSYKFGVFLPMIGVVAFFLANLFILKDERKVRSAERLR